MTKRKVNRIAYCSEGDHFPRELVSYPIDADGDRYEVGILLDRWGKAGNRWEDGAVGTLPAQREDAESDESPVCGEHRACEVEWRDMPRPSWTARVRKTYDSLAELEAYDEVYGIVHRLGYTSAADLWAQNPRIGGSTDPAAFQVVSE